MSTSIYFRKFGSGPEVVLLHGFPMHQQMWDEFARKLSVEFTVYTPDLPGLGKSEILPGQFSLSGVATAMNQWVEEQGIHSPALIGHSMGGYVALEMINQYPGRYKGLCLFHSTSFEDSAEKKESRTKVLKFIKENGVLAFTSNFIQPLFADQNHPAIPAVKDITIQAGEEAVLGYTQAMRDRRNNSKTLQDFNKPILLIGGDHDKGISLESLEQQAKLNEKIELVSLENVGHMGMFENEEVTLAAVRTFLFQTYNPAGAR